MTKTFTDDEGQQYEQVRDSKYANIIVIRPVGKKRWRAIAGTGYWYISEDLEIKQMRQGFVDIADDERSYEIGNYFRTKGQAEAVAKAFQALLNYIHQPEAEITPANMLEEILCNAYINAREVVQSDEQ